MAFIIEIKKLKLFGKYDGLAIWPFIIVNNKDDKGLIEHEKTHIRQQLDGWLVGFFIKYWWYHFTKGYENNPYEIEAREAQSQVS